MKRSRRSPYVLAAALAATLVAGPAAGAPETAPAVSAPSATTAAASTTASNLLTNASFEDLDAEGRPVGWSPLWANSAAAFSIDDTDASDGARSLRVLDASTETGVGLRADAVTVTAGATYAYAMDVKLTSGSLLPTVYFYDAAGNRLAQPNTSASPAPGTWERVSFQVTAPAGAVRAEPLIYSSIQGRADGLVDAVSFTEDRPEAAPGVEENLGEPITGLTNAGAGYTEDANGRDIGLVIAGGSPSRFSAVDMVTGERLLTREITSSTLTWAYATAPDRSVYIATSSGEVLRFDPDAVTLETIANKPFGETYFWEAQADADGTIYFASYPNGKILSYEPATGAWKDHGVQNEGNRYVRSLAVAGDIVYGGGGTADAAVTRLDTTTGAITEIALPAGYENEEFVYDLSVAGDTLFARPTPSSDVLVYDLTAQAWVDTIPDIVGLEVSPAVTTLDSGTERTEVLLPKIGGGTVAYDLETREQRSVSLDLGGAAARGWGLQELDLEGFPGDSLVTATSKAVFHAWNPQTGETRHVRSDALGTPFLIRSLATGPDGDVWVGGYASPPGVARVDADTGASEQLPASGQIEGMAAHDDHVVFGIYPGAGLYAYDTTQPWANGTNPPPRVNIGHGQDRPVAMASAGDVVAVGTAPDYGHLGGALTLFDPETRAMEVFPEPVEDQSVIALAYHDGLIYGGTGIWGGLGVDPATTEGHLFIFDPATDEVVFRTVPVPGEENVSGLTFDPEGNLWGITANELFRFDPETRQVVERKRYFDVDDSAGYWTSREIFWHEGKLVGQTAGRLFEIDPDTLALTTLQTGVQNLAIDRNGSYYYNRGGVLYRWVPAGPACDQTITGAHDGPLTVTAGTLCLNEAEVEGPVTVSDGASIHVEDSSIIGPFRTRGAEDVVVRSSRVTGPVSVVGSTGTVVLAGVTVEGPLACEDNATAPIDQRTPSTVTGPATGQCADL